jgi:hypothetical protein
MEFVRDPKFTSRFGRHNRNAAVTCPVCTRLRKCYIDHLGKIASQVHCSCHSLSPPEISSKIGRWIQIAATRIYGTDHMEIRVFLKEIDCANIPLLRRCFHNSSIYWRQSFISRIDAFRIIAHLIHFLPVVQGQRIGTAINGAIIRAPIKTQGIIGSIFG